MAKQQSKSQEKFEGIKVTTPIFRASFPFVFQPRPANDQGKQHFDVTMLFPKSTLKSPEMKKFNQQLTEAAVKAFGPKADWPEDLKMPWKDGDKMQDLEGYKGMVFLQAKTQHRPGIIDKDKNAILDKDEFYGGCFARATVVLKGYDYLGKRGVTVYLQNLQKVKDGERFGGRVNAEDDFEVIENDDDTDTDSDDSEPDFF